MIKNSRRSVRGIARALKTCLKQFHGGSGDSHQGRVPQRGRSASPSTSASKPCRHRRDRSPARRGGVHHRRQHAARLQGDIRGRVESRPGSGHAALQAQQRADHLGSERPTQSRASGEKWEEQARFGYTTAASRWRCTCRKDGTSCSASIATSRIPGQILRAVDAARGRPPAVCGARTGRRACASSRPRRVRRERLTDAARTGNPALDHGGQDGLGGRKHARASASGPRPCTSTTRRTSSAASTSIRPS